MKSQTLPEGKIVVFYDGYCGLCSRAVDFLIARDYQRKFVYSPLQGNFVRELNYQLDSKELQINPNNLQTLYVYDGQVVLEKTKAWQRLAIELGGFWGILARTSKVIPVFLLNLIYDLVSKNRFRFFGKRETCRLPTTEEQHLFLS